MAEAVRALCEELVKAVNVMMDAESSQIYRLEALKFIEGFKEKCPVCVECGLQLADVSQPAQVRHFGLQILEHVVKFRWNDMSQQEKLQLKNCTMTLLTDGTLPILEEEFHVKDALSRIVVEMIKREWPQNWPDMLKEMEQLTSVGEVQTELVMLVLLRLAEDVITFQTLPAQRRRDILQTLTLNLEAVLSFLLAILQRHVSEYRRLKSFPGQELKARAHLRVSVSALHTLAGFIDWVSLSHLTSNNCRLLEALCVLLGEAELQLEAAECLLIAIGRKGKLEERKPFMLLFDDVAIDCILSAGQGADGPALYEQPAGERRYSFLKRLCQVLCAMCHQLCALVGSECDVPVPQNLDKFLEALFAFTTHPSQLLRSSTQVAWGTFFRHEVLTRHPVGSQMTVRYLRTTRQVLVKGGFPSRSDSASCVFSRVDYDSDEDFTNAFNAYRAQQGENIRLSCRIQPDEAFQVASEWLSDQISSPVDNGSVAGAEASGVVQWDAVTFYMESVFGKLFKSPEKERLPVAEGLRLLQAVLGFQSRDPAVLSCLLSIISTLFPFLTHQPLLLPDVLFKIFPAVTFELDSTAARSRAIKNVRRHACSSIIKICRDYPALMLPFFDRMCEHVRGLLADELQLTQMEKLALVEALVLVSNQLKDFARQEAFLRELLAPVTAQWLAPGIKRAVRDPEAFLAYVGADQEPDSGSSVQATADRAQIRYSVYSMAGVVKRARWPSDPEEAKAGGFVTGEGVGGAPLYRNPCAAPLLAMLPDLMALIRTHNQLFLPENRARLSRAFCRAHDITDIERNAILGSPHPGDASADPQTSRSDADRMQNFFYSIYDNSLQVLGNIGSCLQQDFYGVDGLAQQIIDSAFVQMDSVPDHRLRSLLRVFMKPLVSSCPPQFYQSLLLPLLTPLFSYLVQRLKSRWHTISQRSSHDQQEDEAYVETQVSQEMLEEELLRLLTRDAMDLLSLSCIQRRPPDLSVNRESADGDEEMMALETAGVQASAALEELSEMGKCLLQSEDICMTALTLCFTSLAWNDTVNCQRTAAMLCWTLLRNVMEKNLLPDAVTWLYSSVLKGLQVHGQHEGCNATLAQLALLMYESLRPRYGELRSVMQQIPEVDAEALDLFDLKALHSTATTKAAEKKKKDQFKRLIAGAVGKPLGDQYKKEVHIRNLPALFKKPKPLKEEVLEGEEPAGLTGLFRPEDD